MSSGEYLTPEQGHHPRSRFVNVLNGFSHANSDDHSKAYVAHIVAERRALVVGPALSELSSTLMFITATAALLSTQVAPDSHNYLCMTCYAPLSYATW